MLDWIIRWSLANRVATLFAAGLLLVAGGYAAATAPVDIFPDLTAPTVTVLTDAHAMAPEEVELRITWHVETAMHGAPGVRRVRSSSTPGISIVWVEFDWGTDIFRARQIVAERLQLVAAQIPAGISPPTLAPITSIMGEVMLIGMTSDGHTPMEVRTAADALVRKRLLAVAGVAQVVPIGGEVKEYQVLVDPERMRAAGVTLGEVLSAATAAGGTSSGGVYSEDDTEVIIRGIGPVRSVEDLGQTVVTARGGVPILLRDVAQVRIGARPRIGAGSVNAEAAVVLSIQRQPQSNTLDLTERLDAELDRLQAALPEGMRFNREIFRQADFISVAVDNVVVALRDGAFLVVLVLMAFLANVRTTAISVLAIPLSLAAAMLAMRLGGVTINTMTLGGMAIAIGAVVDDAIIDVENIVRRLRLNREQGAPESALRVVLNASLEVRSAIVYATLIVVLVFLPIFFLDGLSGSFFRPLAVAYVLAVLASLGVALTVTPALSLMLLSGERRDRGEPPLTRALKHGYRLVLPHIVARPRSVVALLLAVFIVTGAAVPFLGEAFLPEFKETDFLMHWVGKPGTSLEAMTRITTQASRELRAIPGVRNFGSHIGRAEVADEVVGPNFAELWISIDPDVDYDATVGEIQKTVDGYPGLYRDVLTYLRERIKEVLTGASASVVVRLYGPDLDGLRTKAAEIKSAVEGVEGVTNLKVEQQVLVPQIEARLKSDSAFRFGLTPGDVRRPATTLVKGQKVGELYGAQQILDVVVWGSENVRDDLESMRRMRIDTPSGGSVPLGDVTDLRVAPAPNVVLREAASRRIDVTLDVKGRDLGTVAREVEAKVRGLSFDNGYHPEFLGEYAARQASRNRLLALSGLALLGILMILYADFRSVKLTALVFASFPFALVGGVFGAFVAGGVLSLGALVGFVTVLGIAARNGIMLVSHYRHLEQHEGVEFGVPLVLQGSAERLAPILMTATVTALALLPIVVTGVRPGQEIEHPMAVVILGGLVSSTLLNLFLMPALYLLVRRAELARGGVPAVAPPQEMA